MGSLIGWIRGRPRLRRLAAAVSLCLLPAALAAADIESRYSGTARAFHRLKQQAEASGGAWKGVAEDFLALHETRPKHRRGADALFSAGLAYREAYRAGAGTGVLHEAVETFHRFTQTYPRHHLADDCLVHLAEIFAGPYKDPEVALRQYRKLLERFPDGDQAALARRRAKALEPEADAERPARARPAALGGRGRAPVAAGGSGAHALKRLQHLSTPQWTRVILTLDGPVDYRKGELDASGERPARLFLDLPRTEPSPRVERVAEVDDAALHRIRVGRHEATTTRVVLDLKDIEETRLRTFALPREWKLVVDLRPPPAPAPRVAESSGGSGEARAVPTLNQALGLKVSTIVLDPGHGGHDPGAVARGTEEKHLTLQIAKALRGVIRERRPGIEVHLTREADRFVPLEERPRIAKRLDADLFLSLHVNAHEIRRFHGVETYFLNLTTDASAMRVAARENASSRKQVSDLNVILADLLRDANIIESSKLARSLQGSLVGHLQEARPVRDLGVKQAPFMVLLGAEMPSALVEMGFITNRDERRRLQDAAYQQRVAEGIYAGVERYLEQQAVAGAPAAASRHTALN